MLFEEGYRTSEQTDRAEGAEGAEGCKWRNSGHAPDSADL